MKPVWIEGEGVIAEDGSFYSEDRVRAVIQKINEFSRWFQSLPTETQDFIQWECGQ